MARLLHMDERIQALAHARKLLRELEDAGFRIRTLRCFFHWTVAGKLVQRAIEVLTGGEPSPLRMPPGSP